VRCYHAQAQFSKNNQYSPNYQINLELTNALNFVNPAFPPGQNYHMSNGLVETVAAMGIPDYEHECGHKITSSTQMLFEFLGGGVLATRFSVEDTDGNNQTASEITNYVQPPSRGGPN
jgi:hypothetical protein